MNDVLTRAEIVHGYTLIERHHDRRLARATRTVTLQLADGSTETRTYHHGQLVDIRRTAPATALTRPRARGGWHAHPIA